MIFCDDVKEITPSVSRTRRNDKGYDRSKYLAQAVSSRLEDGDIKGALRLLCSDDVPVEDSPRVIEELQKKHPKAYEDRRTLPCPQEDRFDAIQVSGKMVCNAIASFPAASSGGPDGFTPQHLKNLLSNTTDTGFVETITDFINLLLRGGLPKQVADILYGGRLITLGKKDGGIRPITIGYTWRRLAAKCVCHVVTPYLSQNLSPLQVGVGVSGGAEAAVHATRRYLQSMPENHIIVKLDFSNAFNALRRDSMLEAVAAKAPEIYRYVYDNYAYAPQLQTRQHTILSEEGTQQGDPLGPLEFCLAIHPLLESLTSPFTIGYMDDLTLAGPIDQVEHDIRLIEKEASMYGLKLNRTKCETSARSYDEAKNIQTFAEFENIAVEDLSLLGAPLLPGKAVDKTIQKKIKDLEKVVTRLEMLHPHDSFTLLRSSLSIPKLLYTLRTSACFLNEELLCGFDEVLRTGLCSLLNINMSDDQWIQASLPVRNGGLGIRSAVMLATSAFLASAAGTRNLQDRLLHAFPLTITDPLVEEALSSWSSKSNAPPPIEQKVHIQREWDSKLISNALQGLSERANDSAAKARLLAIQSPHSGDWLHALPITTAGLRMSGEVLRIASGIRLGTALCEKHTCKCGVIVESNGHHGFSCVKGAGRQHRHGMLNDVIWRAFTRAKIPAIKEPNGLSRSDGKRPDGVTIIPWHSGRCMAWDVTVPDTFAASYEHLTSQIAGAAAEKAARNKETKYAAITQSHHFVPVAVETAGSWHTESLQFVRELGGKISAATGDQRETSHLLQRLSVALQIGNSLSVLGTTDCNNTVAKENDSL